MNGAALSAFTTAAGVDPNAMSLFIRSLILVLTLLWAAWVCYGALHAMHHHQGEPLHVVNRLVRVAFVVCVITALVFVSSS